MKIYEDWNKEKPFKDVDFNQPDWLVQMLKIAYYGGALEYGDNMIKKCDQLDLVNKDKQ